MRSDDHKNILTDLEKSIWAYCGKPSCGKYCKEFSTPDDIFKEEFDFEPIKLQSSKPVRDYSTNLDGTDE